MKIIVTQIGTGISTYPDLKEWARDFGGNLRRRKIEALKYLDGDPDKLKCDGRELLFIDVDLNGVKYILTNDHATVQERQMLERFHGDNRGDYLTMEECKWSCYDAAPKAIAYRGGVGYYYSIWSYNSNSGS